MTRLTAEERAERGRMAMDFPSGQLVYSPTDGEMLIAERVKAATFRDRIRSLNVMTAERALADVHRRFCADDAHNDACAVLTEAVRQRDVQYRAAQDLAAVVANMRSTEPTP